MSVTLCILYVPLKISNGACSIVRKSADVTPVLMIVDRVPTTLMFGHDSVYFVSLVTGL